ncbi:phosphoribosyltransferase [Corynebacterium diphtheriae]|nr:phosphoribosyltransferase [Corynebacterium diphtheriae]RKW83017.1 phosphoribosyltransferase [Corynebacterium diphtheriae]
MAYHADSADLETKEILTWEGFGIANRELAQQIVDSDYTPDIIVAVARGGLVPAGALSYSMGIKTIRRHQRRVLHRRQRKTLPDPVLLEPLLDTNSIRGKKVLVVDDVADSGRTLDLVLKLLENHGAEVRSAVIYAKSRSIVAPNYIWKRTDEWIVFPWSAEPPVTKA